MLYVDDAMMPALACMQLLADMPVLVHIWNKKDGGIYVVVTYVSLCRLAVHREGVLNGSVSRLFFCLLLRRHPPYR